MQLSMSKLRGPARSDKQVQPTFLSAHLASVDVKNIHLEVADRVLLEGSLPRLLTSVRQPTDTVPLEAATEGRPLVRCGIIGYKA